MNCSLPGSSIHGILQARILECVAISFSRGTSWPRNWTQVRCIAGRCFTDWATREAFTMNSQGWFPLELTDLVSLLSKGFSIQCSVQFGSVTQSCPALCDPMNLSMPGLPVHHQLSEFTQTHAHWVGDAIHPSHPLSSPSPLAPNPSQHHGLFQWVNSSHGVAKVLEFQLQHQTFQWIFSTDFL